MAQRYLNEHDILHTLSVIPPRSYEKIRQRYFDILHREPTMESIADQMRSDSMASPVVPFFADDTNAEDLTLMHEFFTRYKEQLHRHHAPLSNPQNVAAASHAAAVSHAADAAQRTMTAHVHYGSMGRRGVSPGHQGVFHRQRHHGDSLTTQASPALQASSAMPPWPVCASQSEKFSAIHTLHHNIAALELPHNGDRGCPWGQACGCTCLCCKYRRSRHMLGNEHRTADGWRQTGRTPTAFGCHSLEAFSKQWEECRCPCSCCQIRHRRH